MPNTTSQRRPSSNRVPLTILIVLVSLVLMALVFFIARDLGLKNGHRDAREKIEREGDITKGPESLI